jgi:hypothetical protein
LPFAVLGSKPNEAALRRLVHDVVELEILSPRSRTVRGDEFHHFEFVLLFGAQVIDGNDAVVDISVDFLLPRPAFTDLFRCFVPAA